jgi:hypothetical protein
MIQINSFIPTDNFTRRIWEFHEDKIVVKTKSLTVDAEDEIEYQKIKFIRSQKTADLRWIWISFITFGILSVTKLGLEYFCITNHTIELAEKIIASFALLLMLPAFRKHEFYYFLDKEKYRLGNVKIDSDHKKTKIAEAIDLIKQKTELVAETYISDALPDTNPVFEIVEFDFPDFLNKSTTRFYQDRILETHKSLAEEIITITRYDELNGRTKTIKIGNENWGYVWSYWLIFMCIIALSASIFFPEQVRGNPLFVKLVFGGFALLIPLFSLKFIKTEFLIFNNKNDDGVFGIGVNKKNREKLGQIEEFVKSKVESQNHKPSQ